MLKKFEKNLKECTQHIEMIKNLSPDKVYFLDSFKEPYKLLNIIGASVDDDEWSLMLLAMDLEDKIPEEIYYELKRPIKFVTKEEMFKERKEYLKNVYTKDVKRYEEALEKSKQKLKELEMYKKL